LNDNTIKLRDAASLRGRTTKNSNRNRVLSHVTKRFFYLPSFACVTALRGLTIEPDVLLTCAAAGIARDPATEVAFAKGKAAAALISQALSAPNLMVFGELLNHPNVQALASTEDAKFLEMLKRHISMNLQFLQVLSTSALVFKIAHSYKNVCFYEYCFLCILHL